MLLFGEDKLKAVAYYRFSAEDKQENSIANQSEALEHKLAIEAQDIQLIESFEDEGVSGTTFDRPGFQAMLEKYVYADNAPKIDYILVYDASRFGRVKQTSRAWRLIADMEDKNIRLGSVDRGIPRGEMTVAETIIMTLDFVMSSEQVRLLSTKVLAGCKKVASQGYSAGGVAPYGYVRILLDEQRQRVRILQDRKNAHKEISNQRVSFEPAETGEADVVRRIFEEFTIQGYLPKEIADRLNEDGIPTAMVKLWNSGSITRILANETYAGTRVYNKRWSELGEKASYPNPPEKWVRCLNAHEALIDPDTFQKAQERLYWLRPSFRKQGARAIREAEKYAWRFIEEVIVDFPEDQRFYVRLHLPVIFGTVYDVDGEKRSCFYVPPKLQKYEYIIACSVDPSEETELTNIYSIDPLSLDNGAYFILTDDSQGLTTEQFRAAILELAKKIIEHHVPWMSMEGAIYHEEIAATGSSILKRLQAHC